MYRVSCLDDDTGSHSGSGRASHCHVSRSFRVLLYEAECIRQNRKKDIFTGVIRHQNLKPWDAAAVGRRTVNPARLDHIRPARLYPEVSMKPNKPIAGCLAFLALADAMPASAGVPQMIHYQGRVAVGGTNFDGSGMFKFALVDGGTVVVPETLQATAIAVVVGGEIRAITAIEGGAGYVTAPSVEIQDKEGFGAKAVAIVGGGKVTEINVTEPGTGYGDGTQVLVGPPNATPYYVYIFWWSHDGSSVGGAMAVIGGGYQNAVSGYAAAIGGDGDNRALGAYASVDGGLGNAADGQWSTVGGGWLNDATSEFDTVGGGRENSASGSAATIAGGCRNTAQAEGSPVPGGANNYANGINSFAVGSACQAQGHYTFALGNSAYASHGSALIWSDGWAGPSGTSTNNEFVVAARNGMVFWNHVDRWVNFCRGYLGGTINTSTAGYLSDGVPRFATSVRSRGISTPRSASVAMTNT